jgi:transposase InsO family protein
MTVTAPLTEKLREGSHGSICRVQSELADYGFVAVQDRIERLRNELGLRCKQKRKFKATTNSNLKLPVAENALDQTFAPTVPNHAWGNEIAFRWNHRLPEKSKKGKIVMKPIPVLKWVLRRFPCLPQALSFPQ